MKYNPNSAASYLIASKDNPSRAIFLSESVNAVNGSKFIYPIAQSGKFDFEKKTPESNIIGMVIRLIIPAIIGMLFVREAQSRDIEVKVAAPRMAIAAYARKLP